jgi:hypothetical protein
VASRKGIRREKWRAKCAWGKYRRIAGGGGDLRFKWGGGVIFGPEINPCVDRRQYT